MEDVKLFGILISPFSRRVEMALKLKGIRYEYIDEDLCNKSPLLLKYNPIHKKIPVLVHNGKPISESLVILEYIEETWKANPILPQDPHEKAIARFWAKFVDEKCSPALWKTIWTVGDGREKVEEEAGEVLKHFENELTGKKFFGGDTVGMVDIVANFVAFTYRAIQDALGMDVFTEEKFPKLWKWAEDFVNCDIIKECLPPKEITIANFPPPYFGNELTSLFQSRLASAGASK